MFKRLARRIDIDVSPEYFVFRWRQQEHRVPRSGYIRRAKRSEPPYEFDLEQKTDKHMPIRLFEPLPPELEEDFIQILAAFLIFGVGPVTGPVLPVVVFHGVEGLDGMLEPADAILKEAAKIFAFGGTEVYIERPD